MDRTCKMWTRLLPVLFLLCAMLLNSGCATTPALSGDAPPILTQDELLRPYQKMGTIEVHRTRYGSRSDLSPADYGWANDALRAEAAKIGADAVILPEITVEMDTYIFFPSSDMKAKGTAIKFR